MGSKIARPAALGPGSRVALIAPAGPMLEPGDIDRAISNCEALGYQPVVGPHAHERHGYLAGTDEQRLDDLNGAFADPALDAVWCLRGGYGTPRLLDRVNYDGLAANPKVVVGYSDITALLNAITHRTGLVTFHGPVARGELSAFSRSALSRVIDGTDATGLLPLPAESPGNDIITVRGGTAQGRLFGGNLSLLNVLVGTPYLPELDGAILFLEDVAEKVYAIDRMLAHLRLAGILERLGGIIIGQFSDLVLETSTGALEFREVVGTHLADLGIPVALGFPIGHIRDQWTVPIGVPARLDADAGTVEVLQPAVS